MTRFPGIGAPSRIMRKCWLSGMISYARCVKCRRYPLTENNTRRLAGLKAPAVETSTALPNWTSAALTVTVTNQSGAVTFPAPGATSDAQRFYRAVWK